MYNSPLIGNLQIVVMNYIWANGPSTVHQVHEAINANRTKTKLAYTTILTVMRNLARRKVLSQQANGRSHVFTALVDKYALQAQTARFVLDTYFGGSVVEFNAAALAAASLPRVDEPTS